MEVLAVSSNREAIEPRGERPTNQRAGLPARPAVLIVEDDSLLRITTASYLRDEGFDVIEAADADQAIRVLGYTEVDAVFSDLSRPGSANSLALGRWLRRMRPQVGSSWPRPPSRLPRNPKSGDCFLANPTNFQISAIVCAAFSDDRVMRKHGREPTRGLPTNTCDSSRLSVIGRPRSPRCWQRNIKWLRVGSSGQANAEPAVGLILSHTGVRRAGKRTAPRRKATSARFSTSWPRSMARRRGMWRRRCCRSTTPWVTCSMTRSGCFSTKCKASGNRWLFPCLG